jgi:O-antigen/teichoic acid export membrane protein
MVFKLSETFVDVYQAINQKKMRMDIIGKSLIARSITTFFAFSLCLYFTKDIILSIIAMAIAAFVIIFFYDRQASRRLVEINYSKVKEQMLGLLVECFPLVSYLFISNSIMSIPRYYLEKYQGEAVLGFYGNIALPTLIIQVGAAYIFCPLISVFAQLYKEKDKKGFVLLLGKVFLGIGVISVVSIIGCIFLGDFGLVLLYKAKILPYSYLLIPVVIVTILNAIVWFLCALLTVIRDFKGLIISNLVALVITFVLSIIWIKSYSASGVNYTLYVALVVEIILLIIFGFQKFNKHEK